MDSEQFEGYVIRLQLEEALGMSTKTTILMFTNSYPMPL